jgi:transcription antitermination factor NusG
MNELRGDPWLVLRTRCRHENVVETSLRQRQIMAYLPRGKVVKLMRDGRKAMEVPLFPGYIFVRPRADQYEGIRTIRGSCGFVLAGGARPATLPEQDLQAVMKLVDSGAALEVDPELMVGRRVKIAAGPLMGVEGELVRVKNQEMVVINVELVNSSVRVEVDRESITLL